MAIAASYLMAHVGPLFSTMAATKTPGLSCSTHCWEKCGVPAFFMLLVLGTLAPIVSLAPGEVVVRVNTVMGVVSI